MANGWSLVVLLLVLGSTCCYGIYEDQVGMWDWHQQYIGKPTHAVFQTQGAGRKRVLVTTEKNVIASLNLRTGEIFWRHLLEESEHVDALEIALGKYAISFSSGGYLRAWHLPEGALVWETLLHSSSSVGHVLLLPDDLNNDKSSDIIIEKSGVVYAISSVDGRVLWTADLNAGSDTAITVPDNGLSYQDKKLNVAGFTGSSLTVFQLDVWNGAVDSLAIEEITENLSTSNLQLTDGVAVVLTSDHSTIITGEIRGNHVGIQKISVASLIPGASRCELMSTKMVGAFAVTVNDVIHIIKVDTSEEEVKLEVVESLRKPVIVSNSITVSDGTNVLSSVKQVGSEVVFSVVVANDWKSKAIEEMIDLKPHCGVVEKVFLNPYTRTDRSLGFRLLVVGDDDSLALLQQGKVVWRREEALASIIATTSVELPLEKDGVSVAKVEHGLAEWLKSHILRLKSTLMIATTEELAAIQALRSNSAGKTKMTWDHNGFRKLIVVLTSSGKMFGLHTGDGRIVWSVLPSVFSEGGAVPLNLLSWKLPHQHALGENPVALVLAKSSNNKGNGILIWVDLYTGKQLKWMELSYPVKQAIALPYTDSSEQRLHLLIDDQLKAHLFPQTKESRSLLKVDTIYFYLADKDVGTITGYGLKASAAAAAADDDDDDDDGYAFTSIKLWSIVFPSESEVIDTIASRRQDEVVHTQAKVLGNRDVMYKYLNKNMIFVATVAPRDSKMIGSSNPEESSLVAYLIDTVTGTVLHRLSHQNAQGPVHAVVSENWVVYHYFNVRNHRPEMCVLEVYDKSTEGKDVLQLILGRYNATHPRSSFSLPSLQFNTQTYFFTSTIKAMTVTTTAKGITGKHVLVATAANQVVALDKRYFDPRRSLNPTAAEKEEGILPLTDSIPVYPQSYISHSVEIEGVRGISTIAARLESTCLVFAYGIDIFYTRTAPSRTYDSLTEDFNYVLLLITILLLLAAIAVAFLLSQRKELREKWK